MNIAKLIIVLIFLLFNLVGCGAQSGSTLEDYVTDRAVLPNFSELLQVISTRDNATYPADLGPIADASTAAAQTFNDNLGSTGDKSQFAAQVATILNVYSAAYAVAGQTAIPAKGRALAVSVMFDSLVQAANQAGIDLEQFELALLAAGAEIESRVAATLVPVSAELIRTFWDGAVLNLHQRILFERYLEAFATIGVLPSYADTLDATISILNASLLTDLQTLEVAVHDQLVRQDLDQLVVQQFNLYAINDLIQMRFFLPLALPVRITELDALVTQMQNVSGMSGMTLQIMQDSGIVLLDSGNQPSLPLANFLIYNWIRPDMALNFQPLAGLGQDLLDLGGSLPSVPVFTPFQDPYRSVFQLKYDADICNLITAAEWNQAGDLITPLPPTVQELYQLRLDQFLRRESVLSGFSGTTPDEKMMIGTLLFQTR